MEATLKHFKVISLERLRKTTNTRHNILFPVASASIIPEMKE